MTKCLHGMQQSRLYVVLYDISCYQSEKNVIATIVSCLHSNISCIIFGNRTVTKNPLDTRDVTLSTTHCRKGIVTRNPLHRREVHQEDRGKEIFIPCGRSKLSESGRIKRYNVIYETYSTCIIVLIGLMNSVNLQNRISFKNL